MQKRHTEKQTLARKKGGGGGAGCKREQEQTSQSLLDRWVRNEIRKGTAENRMGSDRGKGGKGRKKQRSRKLGVEGE